MKETNIKQIEMTQEGYDKHKEDLKYLEEIRLPKVIEDLNDAKALGDTSENADYDSMKKEKAEVEATIAKLRYEIEHALIITVDNVDSVAFGLYVTGKRLDKNVQEIYKIVGTTEADPISETVQCIATDTIFAKAILGKKVGDTVTVNTKKPYQVKILKISKTI